MSNDEYLKEYADSIKKLKKESAKQGINEEEFKKIYLESLKEMHRSHLKVPEKKTLKKKKLLLIVILLVITLCSFKYIYNNVICNLQEFIYPGLRLIRKISIPFVSLFPVLTEFYQEPCLIQNPFFTIMDMDCWPCSTVSNIGYNNDPQPVHQQHSAPFIYKTDQEEISMKKLEDLYLRNKDLLDKESHKIAMNNKIHVVLSQVFKNNPEDNNLYVWKINNINFARILRQIIPRPKVVPKFGQSTERYIIIDSSQTAFKIPDTECNFAFIMSLSGTRSIAVDPAEECQHQCKSLKVELKESYLLWYNWWYWRPKVEHSYGNTTFIAHVGSYC